MADELQIKSDLLPVSADELAEFLDKYADAVASGDYTSVNIMELPPALLDPNALQVIGDQITEEMAKNPPDLDKFMMLTEYSEMLASLQKEYYVITNRHDRIGRISRAVSAMKDAGGEEGFVRNRIKQAGGAY